MLLELSGSLRLFHGLAALLAQLDAMLAADPGDHAVSAVRALADTPTAACLLARAGRDTRDCFTGHGQPDPHRLRQTLAALPVTALALDDRTEHCLMSMGLQHFGALDALPRAALARRFGRNFSHWLDRITGAVPDLRTPLPPATFFIRELHFLDGVVSTEGLQFPVQHLLGQFGQFLHQHQLATQQLVWRLTLVDGRSHDLAIITARPELAPAHFLALTRVRLDSLALAAPVAALRLVCRRFSPLAARAATLFPELEAERTRDDSFRALFDRLRTRLGEDRCRQLVPLDRLRPEAAQQLRTADAADDLPALPAGAHRRPLWLLRAPQRALWQAGRLHWHGDLELLDGPERIDGDWWSQPLQRDYFTARFCTTEANRSGAGILYWVYHDLATDSWHVHGVFG